MNRFLVFGLLAVLGVGCVPPKQMQDVKDKYEAAEEERKYLSAENQKLATANTEHEAELARLEKELEAAVQDTVACAEKLKRTMFQFEKLRQFNEDLLNKQNELQSSSEMENRKLMAELLVIQEKLQNKEDSLKLLQIDLDKQQRNLDVLNDQLKLREQRVNELEQIIAQKDAAVTQLKEAVKKALVGFENKGIQVEQRNGRVYVSMEAKLLFASGSTEVGSEGSKAVVQLAKALEDQKDLTILVEGHTDSDPMKSQRIKDNWDLSVMRATSVVRIMVDNSTLDPLILTAAGRGEFFPISDNDSPEGKAKNRRIEVILTPNLDKLFEILEEGAAQINQEEPSEELSE